MIKKNMRMLIITSLVMLIPILIGLLLWNQLPEQIPSHWDINGDVDGWSSKAFTVFGFPSILLALHWVCVLVSSTDPTHKNHHPKMFLFVLWICPVISLVLNTLVYSTALGHPLPIETIIPLLLGVMFIIIGNLLPKCRLSYTIGIKLPWTLASEENWNRTHRFAGKLWFIGGIATMATAFIRSFWIVMVILAVMVAVPTLYSYLYYTKHEKGTA